MTQRKELFQKSNHCCEYIDPITKRKCSSKYQLQIDHIIPVARGGDNESTNLRILCRTHNLHMANKWGLKEPRELIF